MAWSYSQKILARLGVIAGSLPVASCDGCGDRAFIQSNVVVDPDEQCALVAASLDRSARPREKHVPVLIFIPGPSDSGDPTAVIREYAAGHAHSLEVLSVPFESARVVAGACGVEEIPALLGVLRNRVVSRFTGTITPAQLDGVARDVLEHARD